ncbi:hypothetical protein [Myroides fluvii]|uniref:hypothetical protein n=1 Tax=Myroides fluvii TaxID=2572594 RepID=UPI00131AF0FB|nr:hypothetical protein [Myroides fluvii]
MKNPSTYQAPTYLSSFITYDTSRYFQEMIAIEWRGQIQSSTQGRRFKIYYCGEYAADINLLVDQDDFPVVVYAEDVETQERILLFDYAKHGYNAMFCDEYEEEVLQAREGKVQELILNGENVFEVLVYAYHNIDYDDEMEEFLNEENEIELLSGEIITENELKRNGFDFFGMDVIDSNGNRQTLVEFELA